MNLYQDYDDDDEGWSEVGGGGKISLSCGVGTKGTAQGSIFEAKMPKISAFLQLVHWPKTKLCKKDFLCEKKSGFWYLIQRISFAVRLPTVQ